MKKILFLAVCSVVLFLSTAKNAVASHAMGGDLTYSWISGNDYEFKFTFYRDCYGIPAPADATVNISSTTCSISTTLILTPSPGSPTQIPNTCNSVNNTCQGGIYVGIEKWIYTGTITLPANCSDYYFSVDVCCRNETITTNDTASNYDAYFFATLDNLNAPFNNSPQFANDPTLFLSIGQLSTINNGAFDPDGDSLSHVLIPARDDISTILPYKSPYTYDNPFLSSIPILFDSVTGNMTSIPQSADVTMVVYQINEFRNGVQIGSISRDFQLSITNTTNHIPSLSGINNSSSFVKQVCSGDTVRFKVYSADQDFSQATSLLWSLSGNSPFSVSTYGALKDSALVELITDSSMIRATPYSLYLTVRDNNCPLSGFQSYVYRVYVNACSSNIWPGDANADLKCDLYDVLPIGIGYNEAGPVRTPASTGWTAETNIDWTKNFRSGVNYKHADCNGDGIIDHNDTIAISQNFGLTHPIRRSNPNEVNSSSGMHISASQDSAGPADNFTITIRLGDAQIPVNDIYGIAFELNFNPLVLDASLSSFNFVPSNLGTPGTDLLTFIKTDWQTGKVYAAAVRNNHLNSFSDTTIAIFNVKVTNSVSANLNSIFSLSGIKGVNATDSSFFFTTVQDTVNINTTSLGLSTNTHPNFVYLFPNPAQSELFIISDNTTEGIIMIHDISGKIVLEKNLESLNGNIDISQLSNGVYSVGLKNDLGLVWKKLIVSR